MKNLQNYKIKNKKIIFRADLNVPVIDGKITDLSRIIAIKKSVQKLIDNKNKIFIFTHFGRPNGKVDKKNSTKFICLALEKVLDVNRVSFLNNLKSESIIKKIEELNYGEVCLVENLRFYPGEENLDLNFSKEICNHFDVYVNDAFSASHRNHASISGFPKYLPAVAGDLFINEINNINSFLQNIHKPNLAIIGGSKISTKIKLLNNLVKFFTTVVVGGAMANTFLLSKNYQIGNSLVEEELINSANDITKKAKQNNCNLILPVDVVCSNNIKDKKNVRKCDVNNILPYQKILDIGDQTSEIIRNEILKSKMLLWNGPLGAFEYKPFDRSTIQIAQTINKHSKDLKINVLAGGGDTISAIKSANAEDGFTYISNAGGAFLEWLEGKQSPGFIALNENNFN